MGEDDRERIRQDRRDPGTRLSHQHQPHPIDQGPSETRDPEAPTGLPPCPPREFVTTTTLTSSTTRISNLMKDRG